MNIDLAAMARRATNTRRREIVLRPIPAPSAKASDLFASVYSPVLSVWNEAIPAIMQEYERSLAQLTTDAAPEIGARIEAVEGDLLRILVTLRGRIGQWSRTVESWHRARWTRAVLSATKVDLKTMLGPQDVRTTLEAVVERNVGLVRSVSDQARTRIGEAVFQGLRERKPAREVAAQISEATGMARRRALNIASDQTSSLAAELQKERAIQAGLEYYIWRHSGKQHPRPEHKARDGKTFKYGEPEGDEPSMAIHCGCTAQATLNLAEDD